MKKDKASQAAGSILTDGTSAGHQVRKMNRGEAYFTHLSSRGALGDCWKLRLDIH